MTDAKVSPLYWWWMSLPSSRWSKSSSPRWCRLQDHLRCLEDSQDSHQGRESCHSRWLKDKKCNCLCENPVHCDVNNDPYSSGLGLSGNFSVPLSDHEGGSLTRPSTQVEILCMTLALFGHYLNYLNKAKGKVSVCSNSNMNACIHTGGSIAPCVPRRQGVGALE